MRLLVRKSRLSGTVTIPASKSHTIRAVAIAALAQGQSRIRNPLVSQDTQSAVSCYRALGALLDTSRPDVWCVDGSGGRIAMPDEVIDVGNSGTTLRIAMGSAALTPPGNTITLTGDHQTRTRPIRPLMDALADLGARCSCLEGNDRAPVAVSGKLLGGKTAIACDTSQYLSSLLLACPLAPQDSEIEVTLLNEPDYAQMTLDWLDRQRIRYEEHQLRRFFIPGGQDYKAFDSVIPADFSSATFFLCGSAIVNGDVTLRGLDFSDSQPDKAVADYLKAMGTDITITADAVRIRGRPLKGIEIDMNRTPDALCAMAVTAALAEGTTRLMNVPQARTKETDRIAGMAEELRKMSVKVEELPDGLIIHHSKLVAAQVNGRSDHRIVMALALAGLAAEGQTVIDTAEAMSVTFPSFVQLMQSLGADMQIAD